MGKRTVFVDSPEPEDDDVKPDLTDLQEPSASNEEPNDLNAQNITSMARDFLNKAKSITKRSNMDNELSTFIRKSIRIIEWYQQNWNAVDSRAQIEHAKNENAPDEDPNNDINRVLQVNRRRQNSFNNVSHDKDQLLMANVFRDAMGEFMESALEAMLEKTRKKDRLLEVPEPNLENEVVSQQQTSTRQRENSTNQQSTSSTKSSVNERSKSKEPSTLKSTNNRSNENEKMNSNSRDRSSDRPYDRYSRSSSSFRDDRQDRSQHRSRSTRWDSTADRNSHSRYDSRDTRTDRRVRSRSPVQNRRSTSRHYESTRRETDSYRKRSSGRNETRHSNNDTRSRFLDTSRIRSLISMNVIQPPVDKTEPQKEKSNTIFDGEDVPTPFGKLTWPPTENQSKDVNSTVDSTQKSPIKPSEESPSYRRSERLPPTALVHFDPTRQPLFSLTSHNLAETEMFSSVQVEKEKQKLRVAKSNVQPLEVRPLGQSNLKATEKTGLKPAPSTSRQPTTTVEKPLISSSPTHKVTPPKVVSSPIPTINAESNDDASMGTEDDRLLLKALQDMNSAESASERNRVISFLKEKNLFTKFLNFRKHK
ncbi:hypothetical protein M3Y94_00736400 [Aphelenchoides besseyi]|nr:hypothetical protein M3Y94_00736400 [Aphelenchoides besseyi]KAI6231937.1 hypothetical protein M3Y95_00434300 [Aphelenchoides besseyi]